jgi:ribonuclease VapC
VSVLDASAVLAFLLREEGEERVSAFLAGGSMSTVNLSEVVSRFIRLGRPAAAVMRGLNALNLRWIEFDDAQAVAAAELAPSCRPFGLSLADRACLALAVRRNEAAVTADRIWAQLSLPVPIIVIR